MITRILTKLNFVSPSVALGKMAPGKVRPGKFSPRKIAPFPLKKQNFAKLPHVIEYFKGENFVNFNFRQS